MSDQDALLIIKPQGMLKYHESNLVITFRELLDQLFQIRHLIDLENAAKLLAYHIANFNALGNVSMRIYTALNHTECSDSFNLDPDSTSRRFDTCFLVLSKRLISLDNPSSLHRKDVTTHKKIRSYFSIIYLAGKFYKSFLCNKKLIYESFAEFCGLPLVIVSSLFLMNYCGF